MRPVFLLSLLINQAISSFGQAISNPIIPQADGFIRIPSAKVQPEKNRIYKAVYDATKAATQASQILPALNMAGSELNALGVCGVPLNHAKFVIVFHGAAMDGIRDNDTYRRKYGVDNPNLKVLAELKKNGVLLFVCGQNVLAENIDMKTISPDVTLASDALIVLMTYLNDGYALLSF